MEHATNPEPSKRRRPGFTCPKCGSSQWGTSRFPANGLFEKYPNGALIGHCNNYQGGCDFEWDRTDKKLEATLIYEPTAEEWAAIWEEDNAKIAAMFKPSVEEVTNHMKEFPKN